MSGVTDVFLEISAPARPALRFEAAGRRLLLRQDEDVALLAAVHDEHHGVGYLRTNLFRSPLPPLRRE